MSNFLQRVASTVIQPQTRLRPMLGSVFASPALRSSETALPTEVETASQRSSPLRHEPIAPSFNTSIPSNTDRLLPATLQEDLSPVSPHRTLHADHLHSTAFNTPGELRKPAQEHAFTEDPNQLSETLKSAASNQRQVVADQQPSSKPLPYQPLIAAMQQSSPRLHLREPMSAATTVRSARAEAARRSQPVQREPDEVHIHIGRIEVAAIAQQAPRPAAAAARRSLNLGDYLKHGNGRSG